MSKTIDEKVVSMQFDNSHFEKNVHTSMSTLDKLKQSLKLDGMSKGLDDVSASAKKCDFSPMGQGLDKVSLKFSALYTIADQTLRNIVNSVEATAKRMVSALTIDPIKTGFQEYETQINAVQTILANTSSKGTTIDQVNAALDELNKYADLTIYNFTEMTRNIGTFTAAGIDLETSVSAIQGIANLAAVSGSTSQQASTAMYQLSQALSTGTVRLMDWNSVVNAGMGGEVFQNALKETSALLGTGAEAAIEASGSFRESLQDGWLTAEVLTETLKKFTTSGANEYIAEYTGLTQEAVQAEIESAESKYGEAEAIEYASKALAEKSGKNAEEIKDVLQMAKTAQDAATKVKTFSQLWDVLKESAQSGWSSTWKLIIGDFEEAKNLITPLADFLTGVIGKFSDARNNLLEGALGKSFTGIAEKIKGIVKPTEKAIATVEKAVGAVSDLGKIADDVILGAFGVGQERIEKLTEAGHSYAEVQNKVNEKLGDSYRHVVDQTAAQEGLTDGTESATNATIDLSEAEIKRIATLTEMSDAQLKNEGYTEDQIEAIRELAKTADKLGIPMKEFLSNLDQINGRWLLMNSFKNIGQMLIQVFSTIGKAYREIFPPMSSDRLFDLIAAFHKFTASLELSEETVDKLQRTFKGLFALVDIITTICGGALKIVLQTIGQLLGLLNLDILDVSAAIGDGIVAVRDWIDEHNFLAKGLQKVIEVCVKAYKAIKEWISAFLEIPAVKTAISKLRSDFSTAFSGISKYFSEGGKRISEFISRIKEMDSISLADIGKIFKDFKDNVLGYFLDIDFGFDSFRDAIVNFKDSIIENLGGAGEKFDWIKEKFETFMEYVRSKIPAAISIGMGALLIKGISQLADTIETLAGPVGGITKILNNVADAIFGIGKSVKKYINAKTFAVAAGAIKDLAIAILILVGAIGALMWLNKQGGVWEAMGQLGLIAAGLVAFSFAISKMGAIKNFMTGSMILKIGLALLAMIAVMKIAAGMTQGEINKGLTVIGAFGIFVVSLIAVSELAGENGDKAGKMIQKIAVAMLILVVVIKIIAGMSAEDLVKGLAVIAALELFIAGLIAVSKFSGEHAKKAGAMILQIGIAMLLLTAVIKIISGMDAEELVKGLAVIAVLELLVMGLIAVSKKAGQYSTKAGAMILQIGLGLLALVAVMKIAAGMSVGDIVKGLLVVSALELLVIGIIAVSEKAGQYSAKAGAMILLIAGALLIMTGVIYLLKDIELSELAKAIGAIAVMGAMFAGLIAVTNLAKDCKATLITLIVAVGLLAVVLGILASLDVKTSLLETAASLSVLMLSLSGALFIISKANPSLKSAMKGILVLTAMAVPLVAFVGVLALMSNVNNAVTNATVLAGLASVLTLLLVPLAFIGFTIGYAALIGVLALTAMAAPLAAFVGVLALMSGVENATANTEALIKMATALTLLLIPLSIIGGLIGFGALIGVLALTAMAVPLVALVGVLKLMEGIENATENANLLTNLMTVMTGMLVAVSIVSPLALAGVAAIGALTLLMLGIGALAVGIGALMDKFPALEQFLNEGIPILEQLAHAVGSMIGNLIAGFSEALMGTLPVLGQCLSDFMTNVQPFIDGARTIDGSVLEGIGRLSGAILALSAADLIAGITSFLGVGFPALGAQLSEFMANAQGFITGASMITPEVASSVDSLSSMVLSLTKSEFIDSITGFIQKLTGTSSIDTFGTSLIAFGTAVVGFSESIADLTEDDLVKVDLAAKAGERMAAMAESIPKTGGLWQDIIGESDMATFGASVVSFGECMVAYAAAIRGITEEDAANITRSAKAGQALSDLSNSIPKTGGAWQEIAGESDLISFGTSIVAFGGCLVAYSAAIQGITEEDAANITKSADAASALAALNDSIPKSGGIWQDIMGESDMATFGTSLIAFGEGLAAYVKSIANLDDTSVEKIEKSGEAIDAIKDVIKKVPKSGGLKEKIFGEKDGQGFGEAITSLGTGIKTYIASVTGITDEGIDAIKRSKKAIKEINSASSAVPSDSTDYTNALILTSAMGTVVDNVKGYITKALGINDGSITAIKNSKTAVKEISGVADELSSLDSASIGSAATQISSLADTISSLSGMNFNGVASFKSAISELGTISVDGLVKAFSGGTPKVVAAVGRMVSAITSAVASRTGTVVRAFIMLVGRSMQTVASKAPAFRMAGTTLMLNLQNGISGGLNRVQATITESLGKCVSTLSRYGGAFNQAGRNLAQGFANGIESTSYAAVLASEAMARASVRAAEKVLDIHSPSKIFKTIGAFVVAGFAGGIMGDPSAEEASENKAEGVIDQFKGTLGIDNETSEVAETEIGQPVSQGVADGITENTAAEEASAEKAKAIVEAFKTELDKADLDIATTDLEYKLWESKFGDTASDEDKTSAEATALATKVKYQAEKVKLAQDEYNQTLAATGEASEETQEAYNKYLQEQIDLSELLGELNTAQTKMNDLNKDAMVEYARFMAENEEMLLSKGFSIERIKEAAAEASGYNLNPSSADKVPDAADIVSESLTAAQEVLNKSVDDMMGSMESTFTEVGAVYASSVTQAIQDISPKAIAAFKTMLQHCIVEIQNQKQEWIDLGAYLVEGLIQGIQDQTAALKEAVTQMTLAAKAAAESALDINSPSKVFYAIGAFAGQGLVDSLNDYSSKAELAGENVAKASITGMQDALSNVSGIISGGLDSAPTIRPVVDMSGVNVGAVQLDTSITASLAKPVDSLSQIISNAQADLNASNREVVNAVRSLKEDLALVKASIDDKDMNTYLDSKVISKGLARPMNHELGILAKRGAY